jgi:hypothetical protein
LKMHAIIHFRYKSRLTPAIISTPSFFKKKLSPFSLSLSLSLSRAQS